MPKIIFFLNWTMLAHVTAKTSGMLFPRHCVQRRHGTATKPTKYVAVDKVNEAVVFKQVVLYRRSRQKDATLGLQLNQSLIRLIL